MPTPDIPPASNNAAELGGPINNYTPQQVQYVTPSTSELNQEQSSTGVGNASAYSAPRISDYGTNAYSQTVYTNYGENAEVCIEGAGCETVPFIDVTTYYGRSDLNSRLDDFASGSSSDQSNFGAQARLMIPLGGRASRNLDTVAKSVIVKNEQQNRKDLLTTCISLKSPTNGKLAVIDPETASPQIKQIYEDCQGVNVLVARAPVSETNPDIQAILEENRLLREKLQQLMNQGVPQRVGN